MNTAYTNVLLIIVPASIFLTLGYFDVHSMVPSYITQQVDYLKGSHVDFDEPINTGSGLLIYGTTQILPLSTFTALKIWQLLAFVGFFIVLYTITHSLPLTLLGLAYPPLIIDSYQAYSGFGIFLYASALLCILRKKYVFAFAIATPLMLISQESFVLFLGVLAYEFISTKSYQAFSKALAFLRVNVLLFLLLALAIGIYLYTQFFFYGSPFANFVYNQENSQAFAFPPSVYVIRLCIFALIFITSIMLYKFDHLLFLLNSLFFVVYAYFAIFGYEYLFIAIQRFYSGLLIYTILAIGYWTSTYIPYNKRLLWD